MSRAAAWIRVTRQEISFWMFEFPATNSVFFLPLHKHVAAMLCDCISVSPLVLRPGGEDRVAEDESTESM